jgi:nitrogen fixation/metabolism regulation signal transduction histidine kinase
MKVMRNNEQLQLNVSATELRMRGQDLKIVTLQDIRRELEARELTAWQNLIRVLTHEIMNSVTPISSLATTAGELLSDARGAGAAESAISDAQDALDTIAQRGTGLLHFVESYRRLTHLPKPTLRTFSVAELFSRIRQLMRGDLDQRSIELTQTISDEVVELSGDSELIEQAIINLVRNAIDAVGDVQSPEIRISARVDSSGRPTIAVADNGHGMDDEVRESIFVPFFTTKRDGTGVGLSVVQQIMRSHQGSVEVASTPATTQSAARMVSSSCSTTIMVLPNSRRRRRVPNNRSLSRGWSPMVGSSRTYMTPTRPEPICVARWMRWASPPASVPDSRSRVI